MPRQHLHSQQVREGYQLRIAVCTVLSLLLAIAAVRWWPTEFGESESLVFDTSGQELIQVEEILPTQHQRRRPPPPAPLTPVVVPDDVVLDEIEIELTENLITADLGEEDEGEEEGEDAPTTGGTQRPDSGPRAFRVVEPEYTREARRRKIRAEVVVEVLVDKRGRVETARVINRFLLDGRDNEDREPVDLLGYGLEESAVSAAERWMFRPAREDGKTVSSLTTLTFSFGV